MSNKIRLRFAPSPTGPLHIGGLRTALYNYLISKNLKGKFILRIEDTDQSRFNKKAENHIIESLEWVNINPDESPINPGDFGPYRQSERKNIYNNHIKTLIHSGDAYYAFDEKNELESLRKSCEKKGETFIYNWANRDKLKNSISLNKEKTQEFIDKGNYVIRYKMYDKNQTDNEIIIEDRIRGKIRVNRKILDDKIIFKNDGMPTYHFANVVDDHLMKISHVVRGEEWLPSLALHSSLYKSFNWPEPIYAHLPLILKPNGKGKLSKRDGKKFGIPIYPIEWNDDGKKYSGFREIGFEKEAIINFLSLIGWNPGNEREIFSLKDLITHFEIKRIIKSGAKYDYDKALWFNQEHINKISASNLENELKNEILSSLRKKINSEKVSLLINLVKERVHFKKEIIDECKKVLNYETDKFKENTSKINCTPNLSIIANELKIHIDEKDNYAILELKKFYFDKLKNNQIKIGEGMRYLRLCITGEISGPDLFTIIEILDKDVIVERIDKSLKKIND